MSHTEKPTVEKTQPKIDRLAYRIPAAAELIDVSTPMLYKMIRNGEVDTIKVGTVLRVTRASILRLVCGGPTP